MVTPEILQLTTLLGSETQRRESKVTGEELFHMVGHVLSHISQWANGT